MDLLKRSVLALVLALASGPALAHVTVWPRTSEPGGRERYAIRTPNERTTATVRVEARFPPGVEITHFEQTFGWTLEIKRNADDDIVGAVWTGNLPPDQFAEFHVLAINPKADSVAWWFSQTYADGAVVEWTGAPGSRNPAPRTVLTPAPSAAGEHRH